MGWLISVVAVALLLGTAWLFLRGVLAGAGEEIGRRAVGGVGNRWRRGHHHRAARRAARRGRDPAAVLVSGSSLAVPETLERLRAALAPSPESAKLIASILDANSAFSGRPAVFVAAGAGTAKEKELTLRQTGREVVLAAYAVDPLVPSAGSQPDRVWSELHDALANARNDAEHTQDAFFALSLCPPLTGAWELETNIDPQTLVDYILANVTGDVWLTVRDPGREHAWPSTVTLTLPISVRTLKRPLKSAGYLLPSSAKVAGNTVTLPGADAAKFVAALVGLSGISMLGDAVSPPYGPAITLALQNLAPGWTGVVLRDVVQTEAVQDFLRAVGVRILTSPSDDVDLRLPLSTLPGRTVAWRLAPRDAGTKRSSLVQPDIALQAEPHGDSGGPIVWLEEAIQSVDEGVISAVLANHGRAWLELEDSQHTLSLITRVHDTFSPPTRAFLWSHYLLALDSALRLDAPADTWFSPDLCDAADTTELGPLFRAERMEFCRLRGELGEAVAQANYLIGTFHPLEVDSPASRYVAGASRYVLANLLRRGGRYDIAKEFIVEARGCSTRRSRRTGLNSLTPNMGLASVTVCSVSPLSRVQADGYRARLFSGAL